MPICESCRYDNPPERDFCTECNAYLRWEPTGVQQVVRTADVTPPPARVTARRPTRRRELRGGVAIALGVPGEPVGATETVHVEAAAGGDVEIVALVRNRGELVDHYDIRVAGIPDGWWTARPSTVHLNPFGADGDYEQQVTIRLHPPRAPEARAGDWHVAVEAIPRGTSAPPASAPAVLTVLPFSECHAAVAPELARGRRRGRFTVSVRNRGNAPLDVTVAATDAENDCRGTSEPGQLTIAAGTDVPVRVTMRPRRQIWIGRARDRNVGFAVMPAREGPQVGPLRGVFRQRPWLPWWLAVVVPLLAASAIALLMLWPHTEFVPNLRGVKSAFEAQRMLQAAGLELDPTERAMRSDEVPPGAVLEQSPVAGTEVRRGTSVAVLVALGSGRHEVPNVVGMTLAEADEALSEHFKLGRWQPDDADPEAVIRSQWPAAGAERREGTPVNVSLDESLTPLPVVVADGDNKEPGGADQRDPDAGAGDVPTQSVAFDDGENLMLARPGEAPQVLSADGKATEAAWSPDGRRIAYMRWTGKHGEIWVFSPDRGNYPGRPLSGSDGDYHRPAFSPDGSAVAFVDQSDGSLCLAPARGAAEMSCERDPRWSYERLTWDYDGTSLLVVARARAAAGDGLVRYEIEGPAAAWHPARRDARLVLHMRNLRHVAVSADGSQIAVTVGDAGAANSVHLFAPSGNRLAPAAEQLDGVTACEIAWTSDGRLTVSQGPCGIGTGQIEVVEQDGTLTEIGTGSSPAWRPENEEADR